MECVFVMLVGIAAPAWVLAIVGIYLLLAFQQRQGWAAVAESIRFTASRYGALSLRLDGTVSGFPAVIVPSRRLLTSGGRLAGRRRSALAPGALARVDTPLVEVEVLRRQVDEPSRSLPPVFLGRGEFTRTYSVRGNAALAVALLGADVREAMCPELGYDRLQADGVLRLWSRGGQDAAEDVHRRATVIAAAIAEVVTDPWPRICQTRRADPDAFFRYRALRLMFEQLPEVDARPIFRRVLDLDRDPVHRAYAAAWLGEQPRLQAELREVRKLLQLPDRSIVRIALHTLGTLDSADIVPELARRAETAADDAERSAARRAIARIQKRAGGDAMQGALAMAELGPQQGALSVASAAGGRLELVERR